MRLLRNPPESSWAGLVRRPQIQSALLDLRVDEILSRVRKDGDLALKAFNLEFDGTDTSLEVSQEEILTASSQINDDLKSAIGIAAANITTFHQNQGFTSARMETMPGVWCWRKVLPLARVGIYVPGGSAPLFSTVLMLGIPARLAGCEEVILCTPPKKDGTIDPAILYAASVCGINRVFRTGGAQAIAALACGTETIPSVDKIFGPGNQYVTRAKERVSMEGTAIDMPAGPSEVLIIADESAKPSFVAADLLAQAEHGPDSQVVLVTTSANLLEEVALQIEKQLASLPRKELATQSLQHSLGIQFGTIASCIRFTNAYAPEHLIIQTENPMAIGEQIRNAGSVFVGHLSPESAGDYVSGTNHTLPTGGKARNYSGVSVESFQKTITFQQLDESGLRRLGSTVETLARAEGLEGHRNAITIRLNNL